MTRVPETRIQVAPLRSALPIISAAAFVFVLPMLIWGYAPAHDFTFHVGNWMEFARQWHQGIVLPRWASHANYGFGEPRFIFYPPLANVLGGALSLFMPWKAVPGAFVFVTLLISGIATFILARNWLAERYAVLAAVIYVINPYEVMLVYKRLAAAEMLAAALFPLVVLFGLRVSEGERRAIVPLAFTYAAVWLSNAPSAVMASYVMAVLLMAGLLHRHSVRPVLYGAAALALGIGLAAFYIVPAAWEQRWVDISLALTLPHNRPENNFIRLFPPRLPGGIGSIITVGALNLMLAVSVWWMAYRRRREMPSAWRNWALVAGFAAFFTLPISYPLWKLLPKMIFVQLPWRWLFVVNTACALLFAAVLPGLSRRTRLVLSGIPALVFVVLIGAYASKGKSGQVAELQSRMEREGGVWAEAQYLPPGGVRGPGEASVGLIRNAESKPNLQVLQRTAECISLESQSSGPDELVLNVTWFPAWRAEVNGTTVPVHNANGEISVDVPGGTSKIDLTFGRTPDRTLGGVVSLLVFAGAAGWITQRAMARRARSYARTLEQRA